MGLRSWWKKEMKQEDEERLEQEEDTLREPVYTDPEELRVDTASSGFGGESMKDATRLGDFE